MTQHASAMTYDALIDYLQRVVPAPTLSTLDASLRGALRNKGTAATALVVSVLLALYGTTGVLESARRALNVVFEVARGRKMLRRKAVDVLSTVLLMSLVLAALVLIFVGGAFARDILGYLGLGAVAGRGVGGRHGVRVDLLQDARRPAPLVQGDRSGCGDRGRGVDRPVAGLLGVHLALRRRQRGLRRVRGGD